MLSEEILKSKVRLKTIKISYNTNLEYYLDGSFDIVLYENKILSLSKKILSIGNKSYYYNNNSRLSLKRINQYLPINFKIKKVNNKLVLTTPFGIVKFIRYIEIDLKKGIVKFKD